MAEMLAGLMQDDFPLNLHHVRRRMRDCHPAAEVLTLTPAGTVRASFAEISARVDRLARALGRLGIQPGDRVATFAWNNQRHFELYMAVPCVGAVLHTLNVRLFAEQLVYIVNHAEDRVIFVDDSLVPVLEKLAPELPAVEHYILMGDGDAGSLPNVLRYEELLAEADADGGRLRVPRDRRAPGRLALLHQRHHRQPQGRALLAPLDLPARDRLAVRRQPRALAPRPRAGDRADVPRQRLGHSLRRRALWRATC